MAKWITAADFCEIFDINENSIYIFRKSSEYAYEYTKKDEWGVVRVDYEKIMNRKNFIKRVWKLCTEIYYVLIEIFENEARLAKRLSIDTGEHPRNWEKFLEYRLFAIPDENPLKLDLDKKFLEFAMLGAKYMYLYKKEVQDG